MIDPLTNPLEKTKTMIPKRELKIVLSGQFHTLAMFFVFLGDDDDEEEKKNWL